jgi:two-component system response regulator PilR (NtrC family)
MELNALLGIANIVIMKRILIVEDDQDVRFLLEHVLLAAGYAVESVETAADACAKLYGRPYDLVLSDGKLGDGVGFDVADVGVARGAKALIVTGYALTFSHEDIERHPFLIKPVRAPELVGAVTRMIGPADIDDRANC